LQDKRVVNYHGRRVWIRHARQRAGVQVRIADAHLSFGTGAGVVAVIDSGVDASHPALAGDVLPGYDFTRDVPVASEPADVQPGHPILNPTNVVILDNDAIVPINPSTQVLLEPGQAAALTAQPTPATFGHGTMVASLVRLVAPGATILPLKAFGGDGTGRLFNVIRALYVAEVEGAKVVNLSLSLGEPSRALADAVRVLYERDIFVVAAAGNTGLALPRYPAALAEAFGVASLTPGGRRSGFSSFGDESVAISAPGEALVAAYPGGQYALAWGTSFATPLVAGAVALMLEVKPGINWDEVSRALGRADPVTGSGLGAGRLNLYHAVGDAAGVF
jgi:thermitase